ncbi:dihydrolipoyl dehydrogenase [Mycolicibacterium agri]|uniref:Dihydrolipoyl dehydrogenase n=1 Tax=Mycolicibacterium agri TaxID=36811 RepID=A0A2A7N0K0_MYCAG|nr:dihydrolipoyl dehydrogenase [Mycolicibacterium agri]PEG37313.1 dihydrolipoyl dehydrogenase [Mycolicibacterium agri]GFG52439.1 dihydrolipoyl dehydrogenase [Mycolicibacterium agri]
MSTFSTDLVVLGGGPAGYSTAIRAAQLGRTVTVIEEDLVGGTCLHRGCIPTKGLLHAAEVVDSTREAARFGVNSTFDGIDNTKLHAFKDGIVGRLHKGLEELVAHWGITVIHGRGRLTGPTTAVVDGVEITGSTVVVATGSAPRVPTGLTLGDRIITSDQALTLPMVPTTAIVLGGGVIGVEFASLWASLGSKVTVIEALPRLVAGEDSAVSAQLERAFRRRRIIAKTGVSIASVDADGTGVVVIDDAGTHHVADVLLVATGRAPRTADLGLEDVGILLDDGFVLTDARLRTAVPTIYAIGDIVRGPQLAHRGFQHGVFVAEEIAGHAPQPVEDANVPRITYCRPEIASVGLTEAAAREQFGDEITTASHDLVGNSRSQILKSAGSVKIIVGPKGDVLGVHMIGERVSELIGEAQILCSLGVAAADAARYIHAHPTQSEALGEALLAAVGKPLHGH